MRYYSNNVLATLILMVVAGAARTLAIKVYFQLGYDDPFLVAVLMLLGYLLALPVYWGTKWLVPDTDESIDEGKSDADTRGGAMTEDATNVHGTHTSDETASEDVVTDEMTTPHRGSITGLTQQSKDAIGEDELEQDGEASRSFCCPRQQRVGRTISCFPRRLSNKSRNCRRDKRTMAGRINVTDTKIAGILGGMGPDATVDFMTKVISLTPADTDQDHARMLVNHNPKVPDRQINSEAQVLAVREMLAEMALMLEAAGADFLVMPCNTAHGFYDLAVEKTSIPFLNIVSETVAAIPDYDQEAASIGVLATNACLKAELYQSAIHSAGMIVLLPSQSEQTALMNLIFRIKGGDQSSEVAHEMTNIANALIQRGADVLIAGCTEISLVISVEGMTVPYISSVDVLAERTMAICTGRSPLPEIPHNKIDRR
jgi:aspartate racemase